MSPRDHEPIPSRVRIGSHPLHPMLIAFPIAMLVLAPVADIVFLATADPMWANGAYWLLIGGLLAGGLAAIPGLIDFATIGRARKHRHGWYHFAANAAALSLALVNIILRKDNITGAVLPAGLLVSLVTAGLLMVSGWFGWELTFTHMIGVSKRTEGEAAPPSPLEEPLPSSASSRSYQARHPPSRPDREPRPPAP